MLPHFTIGPFTLPTYALMYSFMYLVIGLYGFVRLLRLPFPAVILGRGMLLGIVGLFIGSLVSGLAGSFWDWWTTGRFPFPSSIRVIGGLVVALPAVYFYLRYYGIPIGRAFDLGGLPIPLGLAIGRLGCLAAGCCGGKITDSWIGISLPDLQGNWAVRYPTQLMSAMADLLIFLLLVAWEWAFRKKQPSGQSYPFDGFVFLVFLELYFLKRILIQFLRQDNVPLWGPLSGTHLFFLAGIALVSTVIIARLWKKSARALSPTGQ